MRGTVLSSGMGKKSVKWREVSSQPSGCASKSSTKMGRELISRRGGKLIHPGKEKEAHLGGHQGARSVLGERDLAGERNSDRRQKKHRNLWRKRGGVIGSGTLTYAECNYISEMNLGRRTSTKREAASWEEE